VESPAQPARTPSQFDSVPDDVLAARTGMPCIDDFVRRLHATGWLHNHERMWLASWLVHVRGVRWQAGADWFLTHLLDGDPASNHLSWQWVAGSGYDAAPYFRVFNPDLQAAKFDPDSVYRARWIDEYNTPPYPEPIVSISDPRARALADSANMRGARPPQ
jgi:deoxyribodipyrimidine photo-lyase